MRRSTPYCPLVFATVASIVLFLVVAGCGVEERQEMQAVKVVPAQPLSGFDLSQNPFTGEVLFFLDDYPVREDDLEHFVQSQMPSQHGGKSHEVQSHDSDVGDMLQYIPGYIRYHVLIREALDNAVHSEPWFKMLHETKKNFMMGPVMRRKIDKTSIVKQKTLNSMLPQDWVQMNFEVKVFPDLAQAKEEYDEILQGVSFDDLSNSGIATNAKPGKTPSKTGLIWRESGFFDSIDDAYLFSLKEGDVSRPVVTGIGSALVKVVQKKRFTIEEQKSFLAGKIEKLRNQNARAEVGRIQGAADVNINMGALARGIYKELDSKIYIEEVIGSVGGLELTYKGFRMLYPVPVAWIKKGVPREKWPEVVKSYISSLLEEVALGLEGGRKGLELSSESKMVLYQSARDWLFREEEFRIGRDAKFQVLEEDVKRFYQENRKRFEVPVIANVQYYLFPEKEKASALEKAYLNGIPFDQLPKKSELKSLFEGMNTKNLPGLVSLPRDPAKRPYAEPIYDLAPGEATVLGGPGGYYFIKLLNMEPSVQRNFKDARQEIVDELSRKGRDRIANARIEEMVKGVKFEWNKAGPQKRPGEPPRRDLTHLDDRG